MSPQTMGAKAQDGCGRINKVTITVGDAALGEADRKALDEQKAAQALGED